MSIQFTRRAATFLLILILAASAFAPLLTRQDPTHAANGQELQPPSALHPFGTDLIGRDVFSRILYGGRQTLIVGFLALLLAIIPGTALGLAAGYSRENSVIDLLVGALINTLLAFPPLLLSLVVIAVLGNGSLPIGV